MIGFRLSTAWARSHNQNGPRVLGVIHTDADVHSEHSDRALNEKGTIIFTQPCVQMLKSQRRGYRSAWREL